MKKILLVDDDFSEYKKLAEFLIEEKTGIKACVLDSGAAYDSEEALGMIRAYPEADFIFLDGYFSRGNCKSVAPELTQEEIAKIICFSGDPGDFFLHLRPRGVVHFPGKRGQFWLCVAGTCNCAKE